MNRLTNENDDLTFMCNYLKEKTVFDSDRIKAIHEKLKAYEDLEEQGLLIKLPCKVGDKLYSIQPNFKRKMKLKVYKNIFTGFEWDKYRNCLTLILKRCEEKEYDWSYEPNINEIGKTVFLTRKEAEKALKG